MGAREEEIHRWLLYVAKTWSVITPGIGVQVPGVTYYEPAFALELEWILLAALAQLQDRQKGKSAYLRLSTRPIDQGLFNTLLARRTEEALRYEVLRGGYRLVDWRQEDGYLPGDNVVHLFVSGALVEEGFSHREQTVTQERIDTVPGDHQKAAVFTGAIDLLRYFSLLLGPPRQVRCDVDTRNGHQSHTSSPIPKVT